MTKRKVMIRISSAVLQMSEPFWEEESDEFDPDERPPFEPSPDGELPEPTELLTEGLLVTDEHRVELLYEESEMSGMEGSVTTIGFDRNEPELISMMRTGPVRSALVFEAGKRYSNLYETPFSIFDLCTHTLYVENKLLSEGRLALEYILSFEGTQSEHCKLEVTVKPTESILQEL